MSRAVALTTSDNPFNPITQYDDWHRYDAIEHDYDTESYFDRVSHVATELSDQLYSDDIEAAIDEAVKYNLISWIYEGVNYQKVVVEQ